MNENSYGLKIVFMVVFTILVGIGVYYVMMRGIPTEETELLSPTGQPTSNQTSEPTGKPTSTPPDENVFCTLDAKQCPDGSFVGRVPPDCEFSECPDTEATAEVEVNNDSGSMELDLSD